MPDGSTKRVPPAIRHVAERVREIIRKEKLGPGDLLPTYLELGEKLGASYMTVKRGLDVLAAEGLVRRIASKGTFVTKKLAPVSQPLTRLGVIYPSSRHALFTQIYLNEIMRGIMLDSPEGVSVQIFSIREEGLINAEKLQRETINGVILLGVENDAYLGAFAKWGTPGVVADYCAQATPLDFVACDNKAAARQVVSHLAGLGHRRVVYVTTSGQTEVRDPHNLKNVLLLNRSSDVRERREESLKAMQEHGMRATEMNLSEEIGIAADGWTALTSAVVARMIKLPTRPTALLTENDVTAVHLADALQRQGLRVPEDVSVCALAGNNAVTYHGRTVTSCRFDFVSMGRMAMKVLIKRCRMPEESAFTGHRIGFEFLPGETTGQALK